MLVSIVIAVYNAEKYLSACLDSCLNQTFQNIEIVVVNDGSSDNSLEIISTYLKKDNRCRLLNKKNEGLVKARKDGVNLAKGEFIFFVDADDVVIPNAVELLISQQLKTNSDIVLANFWKKKEKGHIICRTQNSFKYGEADTAMLFNLLSKSFGPTIWGKLIRKNVFLQTNVPNHITIGEDVIAIMQMILLGNVKFSNIDDCIYHYIQHEHSMVNTRNIKTAEKRLEYIHYVQDYLKAFGVVRTRDYIEAYNSFLIGEYFSFLKDGGLPSMCIELSKEIKRMFGKKFLNLGVLRYIFICSYFISERIGVFYRTIYLSMRSLNLFVRGCLRL